jgi:hypothetical protein
MTASDDDARTAPLQDLIERLCGDEELDDNEPAAPVHWPSLTAAEAPAEWEALRLWVDALRVRYPHTTRIPDCWWQHNDLVEALSALRDYERACFSAGAPGIGPVEWQRALRDIELSLEAWIRRLGCGVPGRGHDRPQKLQNVPDGWAEFVASDVRSRQSTDQAWRRGGMSGH